MLLTKQCVGKSLSNILPKAYSSTNLSATNVEKIKHKNNTNDNELENQNALINQS